MLPRADMSGREVNSEGHDLIKFTGGQPDLLDLLELQQNRFCHLISISGPPSSQGSQADQSDTGQIIHI